MADVKEEASSYDSPSQGSVVTPPQQDWSPQEEQRARRKYIKPLTLFLFIARLWLVVSMLIAFCNRRPRIDSSVLPLLFLGLLVFQLDRMNLASALTDGFADDIGIDQATINLGNQLMFMGIVVLEIPCNMLLQRVG